MKKKRCLDKLFKKNLIFKKESIIIIGFLFLLFYLVINNNSNNLIENMYQAGTIDNINCDSIPVTSNWIETSGNGTCEQVFGYGGITPSTDNLNRCVNSINISNDINQNITGIINNIDARYRVLVEDAQTNCPDSDG